MSQSRGVPADRFAIASLSLGALALLTVVLSIFVTWNMAEAALYSGFPITVIGGLGLGFGIAGLVKRARPRWMNGVGLALSILSLLFGLYLLIGILLLYISLMNMSSLY